MNKTQSFEKLDKLAEGLRGLSELPDKEREKAPAMQKWKKALHELPKKDQEEYKQQKYEEAVKDKKWQKEQKLEKLYEKEIRPNTSLVHFWLGEKVVKERKLAQEKIFIEKSLGSETGQKFQLESSKIQNIGVPEIVDIDYSEIKDIPVLKNGAELRPYKDGFLIVRDENPKCYHCIDLSDYTKNSKTKANMFFQTLVFDNGIHYYFRHYDIEKIKKNINNINFYIVFKRAYKNKAFKITFKNNKYLIHILKLAIEFKDKEVAYLDDITSNLPASLITNFVEALGIAERYEMVLDTERSTGKKEAEKLLNAYYANFSKAQILKAGYYFSVFSKFIKLISGLSSVLKSNPKESFKDSLLYKYKDLDPGDFKLLTKEVVQSINESDITPKGVIQFLEKYICAERSVEEPNKISDTKIMHNFVDLIISYQHTEKGTSLPITGKIDVENTTDIDCFHYWNYISLFSLVNGCLDRKDFPLLLEEGKIFNEQKIHNHIHELKRSISLNPFRNPDEKLDFDPETKSQISEILTEAMDQTTGLLIPHNACVEIKDDPVFKYIRFIEYEKYIAIFAHDQRDRFIPEIYVKGEKEFRYWLYNSGQIFDSKITESSKLIYLKIAACIRDWKVLIERDSTMEYRGPRIPTGVISSKPRQIWLPRTSYKRSPNREQRSREKIFFSESRKFSGDRREHRRKLPSGMKASKTQLILAKDANFYIPEGHTFVKKSIWGKIKMGQREIKYRNKSLNGLFYAADAEVKKVKEIHELSPAGFEEYSEKYVAGLGWEVRKRNNYDGGIDIRALRDTKEGVEQLVAQCKHWKKPIGPDVLRELVGSATDEENEYKKVLMVITSSRFTPGAVDYADRNDIILVDGDDLLK